MKIKYFLRAISPAVLILVMIFTFSCSSSLPDVETPQPTETSQPTEIPQTPVAPPELPIDEHQGDIYDLSDLVHSDPAEVDNSEFPVTPLDKIHKTGGGYEVLEIDEYRLTIEGLVDVPLELSYQEILAYPTVTEVALLICPVFFADNAEWTGVPLSLLFNEAMLQPEASEVTFHALDGYQRTIALEELQQEGVFLAHTVNGVILPSDHGFPVRLVIRGNYGGEWVKWLSRIAVK